MSVSNLFFDSDNTGKRKISFFLILVVVLFVFFSYFLSTSQKPHPKKEAKKSILHQKDIVEAAGNVITDEGRGFKLNFKKILQPPLTLPRPLSQQKDLLAKSLAQLPVTNTKMIVYDDTDATQSNAVIPLGSMVKCLLIHNIVTNNFEAPVIAQVWEDFYFDGKLLLPFGTRIYGTASAGRQRDRVTVKFHDIVFQNGKTIQINAIALSKDGSGGLTGTVIDDSTKKTILAMAMNLLSGIALGFQQTTTNELTGLTQVEANSRNALLNGVANTFQKQAQQIQTDIENSKGYAIVLAGSDLVVYFQKEVDIQGG